jgi:pyrimidine-nucleoside phosphorylase
MNRIPDLIRKKRDGQALSREEIQSFVVGAAAGNIPDYQISAWLMACYFQGMDNRETDALAEAMLHSGRVLDLSSLPCPAVDKHSTGGVGDKTSLVVAPLAAANGVYVPMVSGRGLGHTGGTLDKLAAIPGFRTDLGPARMLELLEEVGACMVGQSADIAPADRKLYALRDATATVESKPLIAASIMSKKLAEGVQGLVLDVKTGSGAFMRGLEDAVDLARIMARIGASFGVRTAALVTDMDECLGWAAGNALEAAECIEILRGEARPQSARLVRLCLDLAARMLLAAGVEERLETALARCGKSLEGGAALEVFRRMVRLQGGDEAVLEHSDRLPQAARIEPLEAQAGGWITACDALLVGRACCALGAGRERMDSPVDPAVGVSLLKKRGDAVRPGEPWALIHANGEAGLSRARELLQQALVVRRDKPAEHPLILAEEWS